MDNKDYLEQISAKPPAPKKGLGVGGLLHSKFAIFGIVALVLFVLFAIIGALLGSNKGGVENLAIKLQLHVRNTAEVISTYQPNIKSTGLRSNSASLSTVLTNTNVQLTNYITEQYKVKDKDVNKNITEQAQTEKDALNSDLFEAKINGILDRVYAHKMAYEISKLMTEENELYDKAKDDTLKSILSDSYDSLENLYNGFNDFSEG